MKSMHLPLAVIVFGTVACATPSNDPTAGATDPSEHTTTSDDAAIDGDAGPSHSTSTSSTSATDASHASADADDAGTSTATDTSIDMPIDASLDTSVDTTTSPETSAAKYVDHYVTFYGWPDNSPPGAAISDGIVHKIAGGTGTYEDPITFASALAEWPAGTILYVPFIQRYVIMEDVCVECTTDWKSGKRHIDVWMNSNGSHTAQTLACEDGWTRATTPVEIDPPPGRPVSTAPLFDTSTGTCWTGP